MFLAFDKSNENPPGLPSPREGTVGYYEWTYYYTGCLISSSCSFGCWFKLAKLSLLIAGTGLFKPPPSTCFSYSWGLYYIWEGSAKPILVGTLGCSCLLLISSE